jgi:hypothetical protein
MNGLYPGKDVKMRTWVFFISFLVILSLTQVAQAVIACSLQEPLRSNLSGLSMPDSRFALFEHLYGTPYNGALSFDFDAPAIFAHAKTNSRLDGNDPYDGPIFSGSTGDGVVSGHFLHSDYFMDHQPIGHSWLSEGMIEWVNAKYEENEGSPDLMNSAISNNEGRIQDIGYDVIDVVPSPGAFILGSVGLAMIGWLRRHRTL